MRLSEAARRLMTAYPKIFFACHQQHRRDPQTDERISAHQGSILDHLDSVDGTSLTVLAQHMGVTPSTMSLNIDRLQKRSYVVRRRDRDDGRRTLLLLTAAGVRIKEAQSVLEVDRVLAILKNLKPDARQSGIAGLEMLAAAAMIEMSKQSRQRSWAKSPSS